MEHSQLSTLAHSTNSASTSRPVLTALQLSSTQDQIHNHNDADPRNSTASATASASPPSLNYSMHPARVRSLYLNIFVISFVNIVVTTIVFYSVKYSTSPTADPDVYYGAASAVLGVLQIPQWPWRYYQLCRQAGKRGSIPPQHPPSTLRARLWWILRLADCFQWGFLIGIIIGSVMLVLCSSINLPAGVYPLLVLMPAAILGGIGIAVLVVTLLSEGTIVQPTRVSTVPKGEPVRPALFYLWSDLVGCDGGGGYPFRMALDARYRASPPFRKMLRSLSYLIGSALSSLLVCALILTFVMQAAGPDRKYEDASWAANMALILVWLGTATVCGLRMSRRALREEVGTSESHTERSQEIEVAPDLSFPPFHDDDRPPASINHNTPTCCIAEKMSAAQKKAEAVDRLEQEDSKSSSSSSSSSFAIDALRSLGAQLDSIEHSNNINSSSSSSTTILDIANISSDSQQHHPSITQLNNALNSLQPYILNLNSIPSSTSADASSSRTTDTLDTAFALARIALATYTLVLNSLLQDAHALESIAWQWHDIHDDDNHLAALIYLLQTLPARTLALGKTAIKIVTQQQQSQTDPASSPIKATISILKQSPALITTSLFPLSSSSSADREEQSNLTPAQHKSSSSSSSVSIASVGLNPSQLLHRLPPIRAPRVFDPIRLAAHEAKAKARILLAQRDQLAIQLGTLAQNLPTLIPSSSPNSAAGGRTEGQDGIRTVANDQADSFRAVLTTTEKAISLVRDALGSERPSTRSDTSSSPIAHYEDLQHLLSVSIPEYKTRQARTLQTPTSLANLSALGPPSLFLRLWIPAIILPTSAIILRSTLRANWSTIVQSIQDAQQTIRGFWLGWVVQPGAQLLETLKRGENERGLIIAKESLSSDLKSLERMVTSFSAEKYKLSPAELEELAAKVKDGDLTSVLRVYEEEMRSPLKSAVTGSLLRALLIQVQKAKVDLEVAMSGIDRLLRSQELLIGAVGLAPALGIVWLTLKWVGRAWTRSGEKNDAAKRGEALRVRAWEAMREIDRLLSTAQNEQSQGKGTNNDSTAALDPLTHGLLLLHLSFLRSAATPLTASYARVFTPHVRQRKATAKRLRQAFLQDIRELEGVAAGVVGVESKTALGSGSGDSSAGGAIGLGWQVRRVTIQRMWTSWQGLLVPRGPDM
ncbi:Nuclear control of ATPase protein 2 [Tilletia horrida]|nr:Nuclear control of ATPase protein 2 [Tilletia horrida]